MKQTNEGSAFQIGLAINDLLNLEGFPEVHSVEMASIQFKRDLDQNDYNLVYCLAYRIWEQMQSSSNE